MRDLRVHAALRHGAHCDDGNSSQLQVIDFCSQVPRERRLIRFVNGVEGVCPTLELCDVRCLLRAYQWND